MVTRSIIPNVRNGVLNGPITGRNSAIFRRFISFTALFSSPWVFVLLVYLLLDFACVFYSHPLLMNQYDRYHDINDDKLHTILTNMAKDNNYCFHCIEQQVVLMLYNLSLKKINNLLVKKHQKLNFDLFQKIEISGGGGI